MPTETKVILPTISINGTSAETLLEDYRAAYEALSTALDALTRIEFNARDYAQQENGWENWKAAQAAQQARWAAVSAVRDDMLAIAIHCSEHVK